MNYRHLLNVATYKCRKGLAMQNSTDFNICEYYSVLLRANPHIRGDSLHTAYFVAFWFVWFNNTYILTLVVD